MVVKALLTPFRRLPTNIVCYKPKILTLIGCLLATDNWQIFADFDLHEEIFTKKEILAAIQQAQSLVDGDTWDRIALFKTFHQSDHTKLLTGVVASENICNYLQFSHTLKQWDHLED